MPLSAGSYRGRIGDRIYISDTGEQLTGRLIRDNALGRLLGIPGLRRQAPSLQPIQHVKLSAVPVYIRRVR